MSTQAPAELVSDYDFDLPEELIAQAPPGVRGSSRMLAMDRSSGVCTDDHFTNLPDYLRAGDLVILNDSRVIPGRLFATRGGLKTQANSPDPTGQIEVLLVRQVTADQWTALVRPARKVVVGEKLFFCAPGETTPLLEAQVIMVSEYGERTLRFAPTADFWGVLDRIGHMPLPPYIHRGDTAEDRHRYQTVFADTPGSAAAPTAGLHFTPEMIDRLKAKGVQVEKVTLHVGLGTFQPVRVDFLAQISLHGERYSVSQSTADAIRATYESGGRIIAVGTTVARTLEAITTPQFLFGPSNGSVTSLFRSPLAGTTEIFIRPGHNFRIISGLLTNFHLPKSTLLMLVSAFAGRENVLAAYAHAVEERYRFFSYGDCMLIL
ncbi:tRNA preQ1(34) S-adenosylmethionine ribosyltransferase-isomerase QueA [Granulicella arctica]|uniref:tRNA preQ1(34) S-adenosylmethionine ribosyltransferase-isomerase QueA n=1 Tax=Granulicella arctica TaxID=940613 RepID=UPI0021E07F1E|nr:tRNA preQ1(34) S-adenosylmethionine ribosyltransferase-isomerase QueA [Granulicella arctica]